MGPITTNEMPTDKKMSEIGCSSLHVRRLGVPIGRKREFRNKGVVQSVKQNIEDLSDLTKKSV